MSELPIRKHPFKLIPDCARVITRFIPTSGQRAQHIIQRVLALPFEEVQNLLEQTLNDYRGRHKDIAEVFLRHYRVIASHVPDESSLSDTQRMLIGSYFTMEYAIESAALFNPSIVPHPDQSELPAGAVRVVLSLRAVGEGHVSSIEFREALVFDDGEFELQSHHRFVDTADVYPERDYDKNTFDLKLVDMSLQWENSALDATVRTAGKGIREGVLNKLSDRFTSRELKTAIDADRDERGYPQSDLAAEVYDRMDWLARSNYAIQFHETSTLSERVIFPRSATEARGVEDARFVQFTDDDGAQIYYATYTAYDGLHILTQLLETKDFRNFRVHTLNGKFAQSKGMALFPRRIDGKYAMISRIDGESLYLMYSDNVQVWNSVEKLQVPIEPWEIRQIGTCGSPIETDAGWLLFTHGVGPMRSYAIGVALLDRDDPTKILGQLKEPLLKPEEDEREGYVPNVVYSCGAMIHKENVIIPYAVSDIATRVAVVQVNDLVEALLNPEKAVVVS